MDDCKDIVLIAPDKFKGSLSAAEAARLIAEGLSEAGVAGEFLLRPMADGGEGMPASLGGVPVISSCDYVGIASAQLCAMPLPDRSSYALGEAICRICSGGAKRVFVAVGGTMVADGGAGMLQALGACYYDASGQLIASQITPRLLANVSRIDLSALEKTGWRDTLTALSDVEASLTGPGLSALDFLTQKGASPEEAVLIAGSLRRFAMLAAPGRSSAIDGAGGGIGFALASAIGASWRLGAEAMAETLDVPWQRVKLIVSGEGSIDSQTAGGKVVETMRREASKRGISFAAIGGYVEPTLRTTAMVSTIGRREDYDPALAATRLRSAATCLALSITKGAASQE